MLAQFPRVGLPTYDLLPGLYRFPYAAHTIFYTIADEEIFIVRVLHAKADFKRHFDDPQRYDVSGLLNRLRSAMHLRSPRRCVRPMRSKDSRT